MIPIARPDLGQGIDPVDELTLDPQDSPGVAVGESGEFRCESPG